MQENGWPVKQRLSKEEGVGMRRPQRTKHQHCGLGTEMHLKEANGTGGKSIRHKKNNARTGLWAGVRTVQMTDDVESGSAEGPCTAQ